MIVASSSSSVRDIIKKIEKRSNRSVCGSTTSSFRKTASTFRTYKAIPAPVPEPEPEKIEENDDLSDISTDSASSGSTSTRGSRYAYSIPVQSIKNDIEERIRRAREQSSYVLPTNLNKSGLRTLPTMFEKSNESMLSSSQPTQDHHDHDREGIRPEGIVSVPTFDEENKTIYTNLGTQVPETMTQVFQPESVFGDDSPYYTDNRTIYSNLGTQVPETMTQVFQQQSVFGDDCPLYLNQIEESPNTSDYTSKDGSSNGRQRKGREGQEIIQSVLSRDEVSALTMNEAQFRTPGPLHRSASSPRSIANNSTTQTKTPTETIGDAVLKLLSDAIINTANPQTNNNNGLLRSKSTLSMNSTSGAKLTAIPEDLIEDEEDLEKLKNFLREVGCTQGKANQYAAMLIRNGIPSIDVLTRRLQRDGSYLLQLGFDPHFAQDILELLVPDSPLLAPASTSTFDFNPSQQQTQVQSTPQQESDQASLGTISVVDVTQPSLNLNNQQQHQIYHNAQSVKSMGSLVSNNSSYYLNQSMYEHLMNGEKIRKESFLAEDSSTIRSCVELSGLNRPMAYKSDNLPSETSSIYYQAAQHRSFEACSRLIRLAENGDVFAQGFVMRMHALGQGNFPKDIAKATEIAKKIFLTLKEVVRSKSEDHACYAAYLIGVCYSEGLAQEKNMKEAIKWYKRAAHSGYDAAQAYVGFCLYAGNGVVKNRVEAVKWYQVSAAQGYAPAQTNLGICYEFGEGVTRNFDEAVRWYRLAADQSDATALYNLGHCYEIGVVVPRDIIKAVEYYHEAAELNNAAAQHALACLYSTGCKEVERDVSEAYRLFKLSADQGFAEAQCKLGLVYENGMGVPVDVKEAVRYYRLSANQGNAAALYYLGYCYFNGIGVNQDPSTAVKLYYKAAVKEYPAAQNNLGFCYFVGAGITKNYQEALKWYQKAAEHGYAAAQFNLGYCYEKGYGVKQKLQEMLKWYQLAAANGHAKAVAKLKELKK